MALGFCRGRRRLGSWGYRLMVLKNAEGDCYWQESKIPKSQSLMALGPRTLAFPSEYVKNDYQPKKSS
jgi:hypothetical protein